MTYHLQFDGMLHTPTVADIPRGGLLGYGWFLKDKDREIAYGFGLFAHNHMTNSNLAEYLALIEALEAALDLRIRNEHIVIHGDAKCVIDQMSGAACISSEATRRLHRRAKDLAKSFKHISWNWVPRTNNKIADRLSRRSLRQLFIEPTAYFSALNRINNARTANGDFISILDLRVYNPIMTSQ